MEGGDHSSFFLKIYAMVYMGDTESLTMPSMAQIPAPLSDRMEGRDNHIVC